MLNRTFSKILVFVLLVVSFLLIHSKEASAFSLWDRHRIQISLADEEDNNFIVGERAVFNVEIQRRVLRFSRKRKWWFYYSYVHTDIPERNLRVTFPNNNTEVELTRTGTGRYEYQTPELEELGRKTLKVRIGFRYWGRYFFTFRWRSYRIYVNGPPTIEITDPLDGSIFGTDTITVSGLVSEDTAEVDVNGVGASVGGGEFTAEEVPLEEGENEIIASAGNEFGVNQDTITVILDTTPPQNPRISIDEGDYTADTAINLTLYAEDAAEMMISEASDFAGAEWEEYVTARPFVLSPGDDNKTIYVKYRDILENETIPISDSITLDTTSPQVRITSPEEGFLTNQSQVDVSGTFTEINLDTITVNSIPAVIEGNTFTVEGVPLASEGNNLITAEIVDLVLYNSTHQINVVKDTLPPQDPSISIDEGEFTDSTEINLTLSAEDAAEMIISEDPAFGDTDWEPYATARVFILSDGLGDKNIFAKFRDEAGNPTDIVSSSIRVVTSLTGVRVEGRQLLVDGRPYIIKGVTYQPTPIGFTPELWWHIPEIYTPANCGRDFNLLRNMGCNTVRTYGDVNLNLLDKAAEYGIMVCAGFWVDYSLNLSDPVVREELIENFRNYVSTYKDHPAILMWALGNEQNYQNGNNSAWYSLANEMGREAHLEEGVNYHPVAIVNGELYNIGNIGRGADDDSLDSIDIWGVNVYIGYSFVDNPDYPGYPDTDYFQDYAELSGKPLWISEHGIDAWDNEHSEENQKRQAAWNGQNWDDIAANSDICIGTTLMSYSDEWWKAGSTLNHDNGGYPASRLTHSALTPHPDSYSNEEWWGIMAIQNNGDSPDIMVPRLAYYTLKKKWSEETVSLLVDDYNDDEHNHNLLGGISDVFHSADGDCSYSNILDGPDKKLYIEYDVAIDGSWAGYYTVTENADVRPYDILTFRLKGETGGEIFKVGLKDSGDDEAKIDVTAYLPLGVTTDWQEVNIPLTTFGDNVDLVSIENISISFTSAIGSGSGAILIDDLGFESGITDLIVDNYNYSGTNIENALGNDPWTHQGGASIIEFEFGTAYGNNATPGLRLSYIVTGGSYCMWGTGLSRIDVSPYENLSLSVRGESGDEEFYIYLEDRWGGREYVLITDITTLWQTIEIPVDTFLYQGVDITSVTNLQIVFQWRDSSGELYVDDIQFTNP